MTMMKLTTPLEELDPERVGRALADLRWSLIQSRSLGSVDTGGTLEASKFMVQAMEGMKISEAEIRERTTSLLYVESYCVAAEEEGMDVIRDALKEDAP